MKTLLLAIISVSCFGNYNANLVPKQEYEINPETVYKIINDNIDIFNQESKDGTKPKTNYVEITEYHNIFSPYDDTSLGTLFVFDNGKGYVSFRNNLHVLDSNYGGDIDIIGERNSGPRLYYSHHNYSYYKEILLDDSYLSDVKGGTPISDHFYWHADYGWATEKDRYLLFETDPYYDTRTNTSNASYQSKITWSTYQGNNSLCGAFALSNLLWTYKINNIVDLTNGSNSSSDLAATISQDVPANATNGQMLNINDTLLYNTGYFINSYSNSTISTLLNDAPIIGFYADGINNGHYALITGDGESLYQTIMWMNFYTDWDIVNTWENRYGSPSIYLSCKYWVDHQYGWDYYYLNYGGYIVGL